MGLLFKGRHYWSWLERSV